MKKINLEGISEVLSEEELKNVMAGSGPSNCTLRCDQDKDPGTSVSDCSRETVSSLCSDLSNAVCVCY